jgi:hypothetical protein
MLLPLMCPPAGSATYATIQLAVRLAKKTYLEVSFTDLSWEKNTVWWLKNTAYKTSEQGSLSGRHEYWKQQRQISSSPIRLANKS